MFIYVWVFFYWAYFQFHKACEAKILPPTSFWLKFSRQGLEFNGCRWHNQVCLHRPAGRCVQFRWAAALSAGAHTGWWSGRSPQPEHSPVHQVQGEERLQTNKQKKTNRRQWTGYSRRKCRRLESAEKSEVNNSFVAVVSERRVMWPLSTAHICVCVCVYREWDWAKYRKCITALLFFKQQNQQLLKSKQ